MLKSAEFFAEPLDPAKHCREAFDCGEKFLNNFLQTRARKEMESRMSACFVLTPKAQPDRIAGFYTLSATSILRSELPEALVKKLPRYHVLPATLLGRLARSLDFKGCGIGNKLMASALLRAVEGQKHVASWALVTDPKNENASRFYESFGFQSLTAARLFLPMKDVVGLLNAQ